MSRLSTYLGFPFAKGRPEGGCLPKASRALALAAVFLALACNRIRPQDAPQPGLPDSLATQRLTLDTATNTLTIPLAGFLSSTGVAFTLTVSGFKYGKITVAPNLTGIDPPLLYTATYQPRTAWRADTGIVRVCQNGQCRKATLYIANPAYTVPDTSRPPIDTSCLTLPTGPVLYLQEGGSTQIDHLADAFPGAVIVCAASLYFTLSIRPDSVSLTYSATGSSPYYVGFDQISYSLRLADGRCAQGVVNVVAADTTQAHARPDDIPSQPGGFFIYPALLTANDTATFDGSPPESPALMRLRVEPYPYPFQIATLRGGTVVDSLAGTQQAFYYRPPAEGGIGNDSFYYYLITGPDAFITRAQVTILP